MRRRPATRQDDAVGPSAIGAPPRSRKRLDDRGSADGDGSGVARERRLFWTPVRSDEVRASCGRLAPGTVEGEWLIDTADAIEGLRAALPGDVLLRDRGCLTAAVYVEGARRSLAIAVDSLHCVVMSAGQDPLAELRSLDPLLAEWLE